MVNPNDPRFGRVETDGIWRSPRKEAEAINLVKDLQSQAWEKTKSYTNIIIVAGYTAFFTIWRTVKDDLPRAVMLWSALLMTISVCIFIGSEVYKMIDTTYLLRNIRLTLLQNNPQKKAQIPELERKHEDKHFRIWIWLLIPTIATAVLGALLLIANFVIGIAGEILPETRFFISEARYFITFK